MGLMLRYPVVEHRKKPNLFVVGDVKTFCLKIFLVVFIGALSELIRDNDITA